MEVDLGIYRSEADLEVQREKIRKMLGEQNLSYMKGGYITTIGSTAVSRTLQTS